MTEDFHITNKALMNEGFFVTERLNILQSRINACRVNPLAYNHEQGCFNYQSVFYDLCSLLSEVWSKMDKKEMEEAEKMRLGIKELMKQQPPHKVVILQGINSKEIKIDGENWNQLEEALFIFEKHIKIYLNEHGLGNPNIEGDALF